MHLQVRMTDPAKESKIVAAEIIAPHGHSCLLGLVGGETVIIPLSMAVSQQDFWRCWKDSGGMSQGLRWEDGRPFYPPGMTIDPDAGS